MKEKNKKAMNKKWTKRMKKAANMKATKRINLKLITYK